MFANFSIGTRLVTGFILVAAFSAVVGGVSLGNSARMNLLADGMHKHELIGLSLVKEANISLIELAPPGIDETQFARY